MIERELKLALPGRFDLPRLELDGVELEVTPPREFTLRATYHDTADLRLARHGVSLRYRTGEDQGPVWTLKLPIATVGRALARNELHFSGPRREPPAEARALVTAFVRREPLVAVATLRTRRGARQVLRDGLPVAELVDDEVSVIEGRRVVSRFRELEVEALEEGLDLEAIAEQLRRAGAIDAEPIPKVVRALGSRATAPADAGLPALSAEPTMADALAFAVSDALHRLVRHDPLARLAEPEGIHQVRVALRRLRSDLRTLGDAVDEGWRTRMEPRLREVAGALAAARDLDVLSDSLHADADAPPPRPLLDVLARQRADAAASVRRALEDPEYVVLLDALVDAVVAPPVGPRAGEPAATGLPEAVLDAWRRLARRADDLRPDSPDEAFHSARIAAKRTRYAAELAGRVLGGKVGASAEVLAGRVAEVQDHLGRVQDAGVAEAFIRATLEQSRIAVRHAFEAGRMVERARQRGAEAKASFFATWPSTRRRRWRKWAA